MNGMRKTTLSVAPARCENLERTGPGFAIETITPSPITSRRSDNAKELRNALDAVQIAALGPGALLAIEPTKRILDPVGRIGLSLCVAADVVIRFTKYGNSKCVKRTAAFTFRSIISQFSSKEDCLKSPAEPNPALFIKTFNYYKRIEVKIMLIRKNKKKQPQIPFLAQFRAVLVR